MTRVEADRFYNESGNESETSFLVKPNSLKRSKKRVPTRSTRFTLSSRMGHGGFEYPTLILPTQNLADAAETRALQRKQSALKMRLPASDGVMAYGIAQYRHKAIIHSPTSKSC